jgi:hypothetical protein
LTETHYVEVRIEGRNKAMKLADECQKLGDIDGLKMRLDRRRGDDDLLKVKLIP